MLLGDERRRRRRSLRSLALSHYSFRRRDLLLFCHLLVARLLLPALFFVAFLRKNVSSTHCPFPLSATERRWKRCAARGRRCSSSRRARPACRLATVPHWPRRKKSLRFLPSHFPSRRSFLASFLSASCLHRALEMRNQGSIGRMKHSAVQLTKKKELPITLTFSLVLLNLDQPSSKKHRKKS